MSMNANVARHVEAQVKRFPHAYQRRLRKLVVVNPRLADVLVSFPALAFALVSGFSNPDSRGSAVALIKKGAPLKQVAADLGLPMWLRKLPPEAFREPLGVLPDDEAFARKVMQLVPGNGEECAVWLRWISSGFSKCDVKFALWLASKRIYRGMDADNCVPIGPMAAYAWFSARPSSDLGRALIEKPWQPSMGYKKAVEETGAWVARVSDELRPIPARRGHGRYSARNAKNGYHFVVLHTGAQLREEGRVMDHCVGTYDRKVANGGCIIISIRRGHNRLATMELMRRPNDARASYGMAQLQGRSNSRPTSAVCRLARDWIGKHGHAPSSGLAALDETGVDAKAWQAMWAPYVARNGNVTDDIGKPSLPRLLCDVEQLAQTA